MGNNDVQEAAEAGEENLGLVRDIIKTIVKTAKAFNVYPKDNPIYQKFITELSEKFSAFFDRSDTLSLEVRQHSLLCAGSEVFHSEERTENIALLLFADGIRQLDFYRGLTFPEITDFIDILRAAPKAGVTGEDDIVTLLWEKNIRNMGYVAAEDTVNDDLVVEETLFLDAFHQKETEGQMTPLPADGPTSASLTASSPNAGSVSAEELSRATAAPLSEEESSKVRNEISDMGESRLLEAAETLFFELLSSGGCVDFFSDIVTSFAEIADIRMQKRDIPGTIAILDGLAKLRDRYSSPGETATLSAVSIEAGRAENLRVLFSEASESAVVKRYLSLLDNSAAPNMIQLLGDLRDRKQRRLLCEILAESCRNHLDVFSEAVEDSRWYLVRNIAMILGMIREPASVKYLARTLKHPDPRVRKETVRALDSIASDETRKLFLLALNDTDPAVRTVALRAIRKFRDPELFEAVKKSAGREELRKKSFEEKRTTLETLAVLGGENAFPLLADLFQKKGFLEKDEITELRASAAYGLGLVGSPQAEALLEKETSSKKDILRESCLKALRDARRHGK
jgi:HEAT repeat protein